MKKSTFLFSYKHVVLIIVSVLCRLCIFNAAAQMRQVYVGTDPNNQVKGLCFYAPSEGYVAFTTGIGYTTDSGRSFIQKSISNVNYGPYFVNITFGFEISGIKAFNKDTLIVYGDYGLVPTILYSTDGGNSYTIVFNSQYNALQLLTGITDMVFPQNSNIGYAVDADRILKTTDRGKSWSVVSNAPSSFFDFLIGIDDNTVMACSKGHGSDAAPVMLKTINGGSSWQAMILPNLTNIEYATFLTINKGWLSITDYNANDGYDKLYYTSNGGVSWRLMNYPLITPFECGKMHFVNDSTGYATGGLFQMLKTTDSGKIWEPLPRDNNYTYLGYMDNDLQVLNNNQLWAGGGHGFLELSTNAGGSPIPQAYFRIDTTNLFTTNTVNLINYSRPGYQYKWLKNKQPISTVYSASYTHVTGVSIDTIQLVVSNGINSDTALQYQYFYVPPPPVPTIVSFTPNNVSQGASVTITGTNFTGVTAINFGGVPAASFVVVSSTTIIAVTGTGATGSIAVTTAYGTATKTGFVELSPTIISFSPTSGGAGSQITITGTNLTNISHIQFGGVNIASFLYSGDPYINPSSLVATLGTGASGAVSVTTTYGTALLNGFTFIGPPKIKSFSPVAADSGSTITITGTNLSLTSAITFGGIPATSFTIISDSVVHAVIGAVTNGYVKIVTTPKGIDSLAGFLYINPIITSVSPSVAGKGMQVVINGTNLDGATAVSFGGTPAASFVVNSATSITAVVGAGTSGNVTIVTPHGAAGISGFLYNTSKPIINNFSPASGAVGSTVYIHGSNFSAVTANNTVYFGAVKATVVTATANMLVVTVPEGTTYQPFSVTINNLTAYSVIPFVVTFNGGGNLDTTSFASQLDYPLPGKPMDISMGDFDNDGKTDLLVLLKDTVALFKNTSTINNISLAAMQPFTMLNNSSGSIIVVDIDGDGKLDIAGASAYGITVLRNTSTAGVISFAAPVTFATGAGKHLAFGDFNGDGKPDLAFVNSTDVFVVKNTSTVGNISFAVPIDLKRNDYHQSINLTVNDLDGDGRPDIATSNYYGVNNSAASNAAVVIYRNISFTDSIQFTTEKDFGTAGVYQDIRTSDVDGDGKPEIVYTSTSTYGYDTHFNAYVVTTGTTITTLKNNSVPGTFSFSASASAAAGSYPSYVALGNLNGDNTADIVVPDNDGGPLVMADQNNSSINASSFYPGKTYGSFVSPGRLATSPGVAICDLDGGGKPEICIISYTSIGDSLIILKNKKTDSVNVAGCSNAADVIVSDVNGSTYQWQLNSGSGFNNINNNSNYSGVNTGSLQLNNIPSSWYGYQYRCVVDGNYSAVNSVKFTNTWTGAIDSAWEKAANWSCGIVPDANTDVVINSGTVVVSSNAFVRSITVSPNVNFTIIAGYKFTVEH